MDLLADLTDRQREAVTHKDGPLLVVAGAGSGKTRVVTRRVAWLLTQGVTPREILALTFTNKAAGEMRGRVEAALPQAADGLTVTTFHSFGARWLRRELPEPGEPAVPALPGRTRNFTIYDRTDQVAVVRELLKDGVGDTRATPESVLGTISRTRNAQGDFEALAYGSPHDRVVARLGPRYLEALAEADALDFDDLLLAPLAILRADAERLARARERYRYVCVDEYQDTNRIQYEFLALLAKEHRNLAATGDPDQNIYAFRGADIRNILEFEKDFPEAKVVTLDQNYRSTKRILAAADGIITRNAKRREKVLWTENPEGAKLRLVSAQDADGEGRLVVNEAQRLRDDASLGWGDIAVFYRTNAQSRAIEGGFRNAGIPYQIVAGVEFYQRKEVKDCLAYLRLALNPRDTANFRRIVNVPTRGLGDKAVAQLLAFASQASLPVAEALPRAAEAGLPPRAADGARALAQTLAAIRESTAKAGGAVRVALERSGLRRSLEKDADAEAEDRVQNLAALGEAAAAFDDREPTRGLAGFLEEAALIADADGRIAGEDRVTLMTLHSSKGLEFPAVILVGCEEDLLPHALAGESESGIEEERRLCYVGFTRAQRHLVLTWARTRRPFGAGLRFSRPSRFLAEIPPQVLEHAVEKPGFSAVNPRDAAGDDWGLDADPAPAWPRRAAAPAARGSARTDLEYEPEAAEGTRPYRAGERVYHAKFGSGQIMRLSGTAAARRATIRFDRGGTRELALDVAPLSREGE